MSRSAMLDLLNQDHLALHDMQQFHRALDKAKNFDPDFIKNVGYMVAEVGEAVTAYRDLDRASDAAKSDARAHLGEELADCLAYVLKLANYAEVDLHTAYVRKMAINVDRTWGDGDTRDSDAE